MTHWHEVRITKYDPRNRDQQGIYRRDEWTSISDIGSPDFLPVLQLHEYIRVENLYILALARFLDESGVRELTVRGLERLPPKSRRAEGISENAQVDSLKAVDICRRVLREEFFCRLESDDFYCHFGFDYYMFIGTKTACPRSVELTQATGLYPEPGIPSP